MTWSISHHHTLLRISIYILIPYHSGTAVTRSKQTLRAITWCLQMKHVPKSSKITYNISYLIFWGWIPNHIYQDPRATLPCFPSFQTLLPLKVRPTKANSDRHVGTWRLASPCHPKRCWSHPLFFGDLKSKPTWCHAKFRNTPEDQVDIPQYQELKVNPQCSNLSR